MYRLQRRPSRAALSLIRKEEPAAKTAQRYGSSESTVVFGKEDLLINNIGWLLRRFPVFGIPGTGEYRIQPVFAEDLAEIAVDAAQRSDNVTVDAAGPEVFTFSELARRIADAVGSKALIVRLRPGVAVSVANVIGWFRRCSRVRVWSARRALPGFG